MRRRDIAPSGLPTFLLPCPHCGHRMTMTAVAPARFEHGRDSNEFEDITHSCVQCGTAVTRTVRPLDAETQEIARRVTA
jgi:endogenous inhibitor of DNA gyrase (YacG/DUF329 family)